MGPSWLQTKARTQQQSSFVGRTRASQAVAKTAQVDNALGRSEVIPCCTGTMHAGYSTLLRGAN